MSSNHGSPYGDRIKKERFLVNLVCARLAALKKRYPATRGAVDDLLTELIVVTIDDEE